MKGPVFVETKSQTSAVNKSKKGDTEAPETIADTYRLD